MKKRVAKKILKNTERYPEHIQYKAAAILNKRLARYFGATIVAFAVGAAKFEFVD